MDQRREPIGALDFASICRLSVERGERIKPEPDM